VVVIGDVGKGINTIATAIPTLDWGEYGIGIKGVREGGYPGQMLFDISTPYAPVSSVTIIVHLEGRVTLTIHTIYDKFQPRWRGGGMGYGVQYCNVCPEPRRITPLYLYLHVKSSHVS
jgi:hypothetical protein